MLSQFGSVFFPILARYLFSPMQHLGPSQSSAEGRYSVPNWEIFGHYPIVRLTRGQSSSSGGFIHEDAG